MKSTSPDRSAIFRQLHSHQAELSRLGVQRLAIFGSVARNEATPDSDVDILVEFSRPVGLFDFIAAKNYLETLLERPVDLVTLDAIRPSMKERILNEAIYA